MIAWVLLIIINLVILSITREPTRLVEVKEKYRRLREHLRDTKNEKFKVLTRCIPITAMHATRGPIGYNTNKGVDIGLCIDGQNSNQIFHVLIHELAHTTVREYSHSEDFWNNFVELRQMCIDLGIYEKISSRTRFCGQYIQDK
jgi:predicted metal-dependent hydrolase